MHSIPRPPLLAGLACCLACVALSAAPPRRPVAGELAWPEHWTVFASESPLPDAVPAPEQLRGVPPRLELGDRAVAARRVAPENGTRLDLAPFTGAAPARHASWVFLELHAGSDQTATLGFGADWWFQAWLNGHPILDTLAKGNEAWPPSIGNHLIDVPVVKGKNILAVRHLRGAGSAVLMIGGPDQLRRLPQAEWGTISPPLPGHYGTNLVVNGGFTQGGAGDPWIPRGWHAAPAPHAFGASELSPVARADGGAALRVETAGETGARRRLFSRLSVTPGTQYRIEVQLRERRGAPLILSLRRQLPGGPIAWIRALDADKIDVHCFLDDPRLHLVIEAGGHAHAVIDRLSVTPCFDRGKEFTDWRRQRFPAPDALHTLRAPVETPHCRWGRPHTAGTLKVLTLIPMIEQRLTVELSQRLDAACRPVFYGSAAGDKRDPFWIRDAAGTPRLYDPAAEAREALKGDLDCIWIDYANASSFPDPLVQDLLKRVEAGAGLVIVGINQAHYPYADGKRDEALARFKVKPWDAALRPENAIGGSPVRLDAVADPGIETYRHGQGRIAFLKGGTGVDGSDRLSFEFRMSWIAKALLWAAGRTPPVAIDDLAVTVDGQPVGTNAVPREAGRRVAARVRLSAPSGDATRMRCWVTDADWRTWFETNAVLAAGAVQAAIPLPALPGERLHIHTQIRQRDSVCDWQSTGLRIAVAPRIGGMRLAPTSRPYYLRGETIGGEVDLAGPLAAGERLVIRLKDADGRVWHETATNGEAGSVAFAFDSAPTVALLHQVEAEITDGGGVACRLTRDVCVTDRPGDRARRLDCGLWHAGTGYLGSLWNETVRRHYGIGFWLAGHQVGSARLAARSNIAPVFNAAYGATTFGMENEIVGPTNAPSRQLCLTSAALKQKVERLVKAVIEPGAALAPRAYFSDHEVDLLGYIKRASPETDFCFSPTCLEDLRTFLKSEYAGLDALNRAWGTTFADWSAVRPVVLAEAVKSGQIPRWIDHRRHMDRVWADTARLRLKAVRRFDPEAESFVMNLRSGPTVNDSFSGIDYWMLFHDVLGGAGMPYQEQFFPEGNRRINWIGGAFWHPGRGVTDDAAVSRIRIGRHPWRALAEQRPGLVIYDQFRSHYPLMLNDIFLVNPDLSVSGNGAALTDELRQARGGIDTFLLSGRRDDSGIGLYYSRASEHACTAWQKIQAGNPLAGMLDPRQSQFAVWAPALRAVNRAFRSVAYGQVAAGLLRRGDIRLLILPFTQAVSVREADEIRQFVKNGGTLLADIRPAVSDEHGAQGTNGLLDDVFGVTHDPAWEAYAPKRGDIRLAIASEGFAIAANLSRAVLGPALARSGATVLGHAAVPTFLHHRYGQGQAILLNFLVDGGDSAAAFDAVLEAILKQAGIPPLVDLRIADAHWLAGDGEKVPVSARPRAGKGASSDVSDSEDPGDVEGLQFGVEDRKVPQVVRILNGGIECLALYSEHALGRGVQTVHITPRRRVHVYDLRNQAYLGEQTESYACTMPLEDVLLHSHVPFRIESPQLDVVRQTDDTGATRFVCTATLRPKAAAAENLVVRFILTAPDGSEWEDFAVSAITRQGVAKHTFALPLNAPRGVWKIEAREAISGLAAEAAVALDDRP